MKNNNSNFSLFLLQVFRVIRANRLYPAVWCFNFAFCLKERNSLCQQHFFDFFIFHLLDLLVCCIDGLS